MLDPACHSRWSFSAYPAEESCILSVAVSSLPQALRLSCDSASSSPLPHCLASSDKHPWRRLYLSLRQLTRQYPETVNCGFERLLVFRSCGRTVRQHKQPRPRMAPFVCLSLRGWSCGSWRRKADGLTRAHLRCGCEGTSSGHVSMSLTVNSAKGVRLLTTCCCARKADSAREGAVADPSHQNVM